MKTVLIVVLLMLAGCATPTSDPEMAEVTGQVVYRERIAAPPNARLEVVLQDISRAGAPAVRLGEMVVENAGQPPYEFAIAYDPADIDPRHTYAVAARLYDGEQLLFISDTVHQVITRDFPSTATIVMRQTGTASTHPLGAFPASFSGIRAGADSPGTEIQLDLLANGVYFLRETSQHPDHGTAYDLGRYLLSSHHDQLTLYGGREMPARLAISSPDTLVWQYPAAAGTQSRLDHDLPRQPDLPLLQPRVTLRGEYRYLAGAGRFRDCLTGLDMPVASEADNRALEEAYLAQRDQPGEALMVHVYGRIEQRMPMEGPGPLPTLVPERFRGVSEHGCPEPPRLAELKNTYWRLSLIESSLAERWPNQREPHLVFHEDGRVAGSDGCNRVTGGYEADGSSIRLSRLATTRMACPAGMNQAERFGQVLDEVEGFRIVGQYLEMLGPDGKVRLLFEAVALD